MAKVRPIKNPKREDNQVLWIKGVEWGREPEPRIGPQLRTKTWVSSRLLGFEREGLYFSTPDDFETGTSREGLTNTRVSGRTAREMMEK